MPEKREKILNLKKDIQEYENLSNLVYQIGLETGKMENLKKEVSDQNSLLTDLKVKKQELESKLEELSEKPDNMQAIMEEVNKTEAQLPLSFMDRLESWPEIFRTISLALYVVLYIIQVRRQRQDIFRQKKR